MRGHAALAVLLAGGTLATRAGAVEREHALGVDAGPAVLVIADKSTPDVGGTVGLHYSYGLSDAFNLVASAGWSLLAVGNLQDGSSPPTRPTNMTNVNAGVAYVLDVLQWVPWISGELGGYALQGGTIGGVKLDVGVAVGLGLDYKLNRSWSVGVAVHQHFLLDMSTYPSFTQALARFEYVWGW
jgi:hypothetical protein